MSKFRKKPVVIDAIQYAPRGAGSGNFFFDMPDWLEFAYEQDVVSNVVSDTHPEDRLKIMTLEGVMYADMGDWIIRGVKGEIYACKPDIFEMTYDAVPQSPQEIADD